MTNKKHPDNFYLNVTHIGDRIFHKHYNSHTKQKTLDIIESFPIDLYVENNKKSNFKGLHGEKLLTVSFDSLRTAREYIKTHSSKEIHGQEKFVYQFIRNEYPNKINFDITKFNIGNIDIETAFGVSPYHKEHIIKIRDKDTIVNEVSLIEFESTYNPSEYKVWDEEVDRYLNYQDTCYKASDGFPTPEKANQMITAITIKVFGERHKFITFGLTDYIEQHENTQYVKCKDEAQLLTKFLRVWQALDIDILTGFYIGGFDIPYLVNRINNVLGDNRANELSPLSKHTKRGLQACTLDGGKESYKILGITIYDYIDLFKKFAETNLSSYSLNAVAAHVLGEQKLDYSEMGNLMDLYNGIIAKKAIDRLPRDNDTEVLKLGRHRAFLKDILDTEQDATIEKDYNEIDARIKQICLDTFYTYNVQDVRLVERLDDKQKLIMLALTLSFLTKAKQEDVFSPVRVWESLIYNELAKDGIAVPPKKHHHIDGKFAGAYVKEPIPGFYRWIMSTDLTSLYPMIMWQYNISPETQLTSATGNYVKEIVDGSFNTDFLLDNDSTLIANGATFSRGKEGIIPRMVKTLFAERKRNKNEQLAIESKIESNKKSLSKEELDKLESIRLVKYVTQMGFKILLNALYGSTGNEHFRYFSLDIAEGITLTGQVTIKFIENKTNEYLNNIFNTENIEYSKMLDTDSLFFHLENLVDENFTNVDYNSTEVIDFLDNWAIEKLEPYYVEKFAELAVYLNAKENKMHMKREKICPSGIIRGKKNYILLVSDNEGVRFDKPKFTPVGVEYRRTSTPDYVKPIMKKCYVEMLQHDKHNPKEAEVRLQDIISDFRKEYETADLADIAFPRGIKDMDKWFNPKDNTQWIKGAPIHVKAGITHNKLLKETGLYKQYPFINNGDKIKFIYLKHPNPTNTNTIGFKDFLYPEFEIDKYIDKEMQFNKSFLEPIRSLTSLLGWNTEKINSIDDMFGLDEKEKFVPTVKPKRVADVSNAISLDDLF